MDRTNRIFGSKDLPLVFSITPVVEGIFWRMNLRGGHVARGENEHTWQKLLPFYLVIPLFHFLDRVCPPHSTKSQLAFFGMVKSHVCHFIETRVTLFHLANRPFFNIHGDYTYFDLFIMIFGGSDDNMIAVKTGMTLTSVRCRTAQIRLLLHGLTLTEAQGIMSVFEYHRGTPTPSNGPDFALVSVG